MKKLFRPFDKACVGPGAGQAAAERKHRLVALSFPLHIMHLRFFALLFYCAILPLHGEVPQSMSPALAGALRKSGLPPAAESVTIPFNSTLLGALVEVTIDGTPVQLQPDTGASSTILSPEAARKIRLQTEGGSEKGTSADGKQVVTRRALTKRISIGAAWTENEPVFIAEMIAGFDGLLGVATLADWDVRMDPSTKKLTLFLAGKAPPLEGETVLPLTCRLFNPEVSTSNRQEFRKIELRVPVRVGQHELLAVPDTGHGTIFQLSSVLMEKYAPEAMKDALPGLATSTTLSGKSMSRQVKLPEFTFGPDTLRDLPANVIEAPPGSTFESKGLIGLNLLRHYVMTFRFAAGELRLKPLGTVQEITHASTAGINFAPGFKILSVVPNRPADKAGLRAGDEVLEIEGHPLKIMTPVEFAALKRLPPGSVVKLRYRRGELSPVEISLALEKE